VVEEANLIANNAEWIYNTRASRHFYANKELIQHFEDVVYGECVYMGNSTTIRVIGKEKILVKFTFGKLLSNLFYVPSLRSNLLFGILLNKAGLKTVAKDEKVIISRNGLFVGKGYLNENLFVINLAPETLNGNPSTSVYIVESVDLWHRRLRPYYFASIKQLKHIRLISAMNVITSPNVLCAYKQNMPKAL